MNNPILTVQAAFELPLDFIGTPADAILLMGEYLKSVESQDPFATGNVVSLPRGLWERFWSKPKVARVQIACGIHKLDPPSNTMQPVDMEQEV